MIRLSLILLLWGAGAHAEVLVAARTIPAQSIIGPEDLLLRDIKAPGALIDPNTVIGQEARIALFAGRPIRGNDIGTPAVVDRNQLIPLLFESFGLIIRTEGRALDRAGPGDVIRVMNVSSRTTVTATIDAAGIAHVMR